jgi:hypothetical protein
VGLQVADKPEAPTSWARARARIDRGETGDNIAVDDPAAAPLGTDAEAGGASTAATDIARSAELQSQAGRPAPPHRRPARPVAASWCPGWVVILALAIAVIAALLVAK